MTDATTNQNLGFGMFFQGRWAQARWPPNFVVTDPSIALLELIPIVLALTMWDPELHDGMVVLKSDNQAAVAMVNKQMSPC